MNQRDLNDVVQHILNQVNAVEGFTRPEYLEGLSFYAACSILLLERYPLEGMEINIGENFVGIVTGDPTSITAETWLMESIHRPLTFDEYCEFVGGLVDGDTLH